MRIKCVLALAAMMMAAQSMAGEPASPTEAEEIRKAEQSVTDSYCIINKMAPKEGRAIFNALKHVDTDLSSATQTLASDASDRHAAECSDEQKWSDDRKKAAWLMSNVMLVSIVANQDARTYGLKPPGVGEWFQKQDQHFKLSYLPKQMSADEWNSQTRRMMLELRKSKIASGKVSKLQVKAAQNLMTVLVQSYRLQKGMNLG
jgi:hypothetical protein